MTWARLPILLSLLAASCSRKAPDATPEGAFNLFLQACEEAPHDPSAASRAFALLAPSSRKALQLRAQRATALLGKPVAPEQILVPGFTPLRFEIAKTATSVLEGGTRAIVEVTGPDPATQRTRVPLEREGEGWRVVIVVP